MDIEVPANLQSGILDFIKHFFEVSDNRNALQEYIDAFTTSATLKFGNAEIPADKIPQLRQAMWDQVATRQHIVTKVYPSDSPNDYILLGKVNLKYENGHSADNTEFAARMQFDPASPTLKMKHYQVFFDASPAKIAKSMPKQSAAFRSLLVDLPSKKLHVTQCSQSGSAIFFFHGLGSNTTYWHKVISSSSFIKTHSVYLVDFDGHGHSPLSGPITLSSLSQDVIDLLDALKIKSATLVGHSMSGLVMATVAAEHPNRIDRLITVGGVQQLPESGQANMRHRATLVRNKGLGPVSDAVANGALSKRTKRAYPEVVEMVKSLVKSTNPLGYIVAVEALVEAVDPTYSNIKAPTMLIGGSEDAMAPPDALRSLAKKIPSCRVEILEEVGHWQAVENPQKVAAVIDEFLSLDLHSQSQKHHLVVGTFDSPHLYVLEFDIKRGTLQVTSQQSAKGSHSWLAMNEAKTHLYATCWSDPPGLASYSIKRDKKIPQFSLLNVVPTASRSGYVTVSKGAAYSAGGSWGEVYALDQDTGAYGELLQKLNFSSEDSNKQGSVMDFGGLRHGAHSADLSPDGSLLYVADIGRNCIWTMGVDKSGKTHSQRRVPSRRKVDGPRHVWPHPNGEIVYCLQEHSCVVDVLQNRPDGHLEWRSSVRIIPEAEDEKLYWADEVRLSLRADNPSILFASTRGLESGTKGWLAAFALDESGLFANTESLCFWRTPTSGGWANAIEPAPFHQEEREYLALTDSEEGQVMIVAWEKRQFSLVATAELPEGGAATSQWL